MLSPASPNHARVLFWLTVLMCVITLCAIGVAELFMPENLPGQKGVLTFYRVFGGCLLAESFLGGWAYAQSQRLEGRTHVGRPAGAA